MKSKIILFICIICLLLSVVGCGNENESTDYESVISEEAIPDESVAVETQEVTMDEIETQEAAPNENTTVETQIVVMEDGIPFEELPDDIKGTIIPVDSLMMYHIEMGGEYAPEDPQMLWLALYYAIGNYGAFYNRAEYVDSELAVESMVISEFISAFSTEIKEIPQIPDSLSGIIRYDSEKEMYFFGVGDRGLSQTEILSYEYVDSNTLKISARLYAMDDDSTICAGDFTLVRNEYASGVIEPLFYFTVSEAEFSVE